MRRERLLLYASLTANLILVVMLVTGLGRLKLAEIQAQHALRESQQAAERLREREDASRARAATKPAFSSDDLLELARLRNEVTRLRGEQRAAAPKPGSPPARPAAPVASTPPTPASSIQTLTTALSANVGLGQALAIGGWGSPTPGRRIVGFVTPEAQPDSPGGVVLTTRLMELPDAAMDQFGIHGLRTDQANSQSQSLLTAEQMQALITRAERADGVDVLSAPRVLTLSGRAAQVSVRQARPDGTETGPLINLTPTLDATGTSVRLDVGVELNLPTKP